MKEHSNNSNNPNARIIETLKLLGSQILELRAITDSQNEIFNNLKQDVESLKRAQEDLQGDMKMFIIDQKDLAKQIKLVKRLQDRDKVMDDRLNNFEDLAREFYPSYDHSKLFSDQQQASQVSQTSNNQKNPNNQTNRSPIKNQTNEIKPSKGFMFGRIPKLLNLD